VSRFKRTQLETTLAPFTWVVIRESRRITTHQEISMNILRTIPLGVLLIVVTNVGCREAASSPARPNLEVAAADTVPGGCTDRVCTFKSLGDAASTFWTTPVGPAIASDTGGGGGGTFISGNVSVSRGGERGAQQAFLFYSVFECFEFSCALVAGGFGEIPSSDFDTRGQRYRVSTNTANNPNFFTFAGLPGEIAIEWIPDDLFRTTFNGVRRSTNPEFSEQEVGKSEDQSATATGSVVGFAIGSGSSGQMSASRDMRITINR